MSTTMIVILVLAVVALLIGVLAARGGGPRITTIETKHKRKDDGGDA